MEYYILPILAYLTGSIPFGYMIAKFIYKIDIRGVGSGNIGSTNVARNCGKLAGILTFLLDFCKGVSVLVYSRIFMQVDINWELLVCAFAILGHSYSIFLKFKGGKAVATAFACLLVVYTQVALNLALFWVFIFAVFATVSVASISSAILLVFFATQSFIYLHHIPTVIFMVFVSFLIVFKHLPNIRQIRQKLS